VNSPHKKFAGGPLVAVLAAVLMAATSFVVAPIGRAAELPSSSASPVVTEGEVLAPAVRVNDASASGGAFARTRTLEAPLAAGPGTFVLRGRVKAASSGFAELITHGELLGSWALKTTWQTIQAVVWVNAGELVGMRAMPPQGSTSTPKIDIDWLSVETTAARLTARGTRVLGLNGTQWVPRGVNMPTMHVGFMQNGKLQLNRDTPAEDFYRWGATMVRIAMNQEHWLANCPSMYGSRTMGYRDAIADAVHELTSRGIAAMLTLTIIERNKATGCQYPDLPRLKEMSDMRSLTFWNQVASTFKDNPLVIFDLFNEPHDISDSKWRNGGTVYYKERVNGVMKTKSYRASGMQDLIDEIRSVGALNLLSVSGMHWAGKADVLVSKPLNASGFFAGMHVYCHDCGANNPHLPNRFPSGVDAAMKRFPIVVTEAGWLQSNKPKFNRLVINWAEANADGWSIYAFLGEDGACTVAKDWNQTFNIGNALTIEPSFRGASTWNALAAVRQARGFAAALVPE
jgi:hypothetical protein